MKSKIASLKINSITELSKAEQREVKGGGWNSPCCTAGPYYNPSNCAAYRAACPSCGWQC